MWGWSLAPCKAPPQPEGSGHEREGANSTRQSTARALATDPITGRAGKRFGSESQFARNLGTWETKDPQKKKEKR